MRKQNEVVREYVDIEKLYLDPNNPRIVPIEKGKDTGIEDIKNDNVQATTLKLMYDLAKAGINEYYTRLSKEGFLESFPLRVARLPGGGYVMNDGNTRVVAAKQIIQDAALNKVKLSKEMMDKVRFVPVEIVGDYGGKEWLKMQAKIHLQGPRTWTSAKRAGFVMKVLRKRMTKEEINDVLQSNKDIVNRYQMAIAAYFDLRNKFGDRIEEGHFNVVKELMKNPACRRYLGWDAKNKTFKNQGHLAQFMALVSPTNGIRPKITASNAKDFRVLGDSAAEWDTYLNGSDKDRKFIANNTEKGKTINALIFSLLKRLDNPGERDLRNFEYEAAGRLVTVLNRTRTTSKNFAKLAAV